MAGGVNSTITKTYTGLIDTLNSSLEAFDKGYFAETFKYTDNALVRTFFEEAKEDTSGGTRCEWEVRLRESGTAQWIQPYGVTGNVQQTFTGKANAPWRAFEEKLHHSTLEDNFNRGPNRLVDIQMVRMSAAMESLYNLLEEALAGSLPTQADVDQILGLQYWLSPCGTNNSGTYLSATDAIGGFNGQVFRSLDNSTSTTIGGIDASDVSNTRWRSYCATHSGEMTPELVACIRRALTRTNFKTIKGADGKTLRQSGKQVLLMGHTFADQYEDIVNNGPDFLNGDAAGKTDIKIRKTEIVRVPALDTYSHLPVFGVNTRWLYGRTLAGNWMTKIPYTNDRDSLHTYTAGIIGQCQLVCDNRRQAGFQIHGVLP